MLLLPAICFFLATSFKLSPELAVGMMLLAASPGGITANLYSHLFKADVALNISLTAINSVLAIVSIPLIVNFSLGSFMANQQHILLQFRKTLEVIVLILTPVAIGMFIHARFPRFAHRMDKPVKIGSALILVLLIAAILKREWASIASHFEQVGVASLLFNIASMGVGYCAGKFTRLTEGQSRALAFEIGIHSSTLTIYLALAVLQNGVMAIPGAIYGLMMFLTAAIFGWCVVRTSKADAPVIAGDMVRRA